LRREFVELRLALGKLEDPRCRVLAIAASPGAISISTVSAFVRLIVPGVLLLAAGCAGTPAVLSTSGGPGIAQSPPLPSPPSADNAPQSRVAVSAFDYKLTQRAAIGQGLADMLSDALSNSGRFQPQAAAPTGQPGDAQLLIGGSIVAFDPACAGGSQIIVFGNQACVTVNIRVVDAATGKLLKALTVDGTSAGSGGGMTFTRGNLPVSLGVYSKTPMEQAIRNCIEKAAHAIAAISFE
jgi:curli biogenesis system outer membrane secretion channel CsgG